VWHVAFILPQVVGLPIAGFLIEPIGARLNNCEFAGVHQHMKEEGENLKRPLEIE